MTEEQFRRLDLGDVLISPLGTELPVTKVERRKAHMLGSVLVTRRVTVQGGTVVDGKNFARWRRKGATE